MQHAVLLGADLYGHAIRQIIDAELWKTEGGNAAGDSSSSQAVEITV
jgi:hypothetical protein